MRDVRDVMQLGQAADRKVQECNVGGGGGRSPCPGQVRRVIAQCSREVGSPEEVASDGRWWGGDGMASLRSGGEDYGAKNCGHYLGT